MSEPLKVGDYVRVSKGIFKGRVGIVTGIEHTGEELSVTIDHKGWPNRGPRHYFELATVVDRLSDVVDG